MNQNKVIGKISNLIYHIFAFFFACFVHFSCRNKSDVELSKALTSSAGNINQLQIVLDHYSKPNDSLKLKAAKFLIRNMPLHEGYTAKEIAPFERLFSTIDSLSVVNETMSNDEKLRISDSITSIYGRPSLNAISPIPDTKIVTSDFLIANIDYAFEAWRNAPWGKNIAFNDFCEYILPYRIRNEKLESWRPYLYSNYYPMVSKYDKKKDLPSVYEYMKWKLGYDVNFTTGFEKYFPFAQSITNLLEGRIGGCEATTYFTTSALRSVAIPSSIDYIPHWGNSNSQHWLVHLINNKKNKFLISNDNNAQVNTWSFVDFSSEYSADRHHFQREELPRGIYITNVRTIPKIYRYTYSADSMLLDLNNSVPKEFIPQAFQNRNLKDVTDEYLQCAFYSFDVKEKYKKYKAIYLCAFDIEGWKPVAVTKLVGNFASFERLGCYTVYLPSVYDQGKFIPTGDPFYLDSLNIIRTFHPDDKIKQNVKLLRKAPLYAYTAYHTESLKGGRFEGANDQSFRDAEVLFSVDNYPFYLNDAKVTSKKTYRYLRYVSPPNGSWEPDNIAEIQFYVNDDEKPLKGTFIGVEGTKDHEIDKAFDNDIATYYQNSGTKNTWIGIDLGLNHAKRINKIKFCPKNDTNCIMPKNEYELFYWNNGWVSLGSKTALDYSLTYTQIPKDGLFWLKCKSGGIEERIFSIENRMQIWW